MLMKSFIAIASCLLLCSCADMVVTKTYVPNSAGQAPGIVDAKDVGSRVRYQTNCGVAEANPSAIYIRPFCVDSAIFRGDEGASDGEMPIAQSVDASCFCRRS